MTANERQVFRRFAPVLWVSSIIVVLAAFFFDPFDLHPVDGWLLERLGAPSSSTAAGDSASDRAELWTCGMHPHVLEENPGQCPICGMNLVPVEGEVAAPDRAELWTCGMHPHVLEENPGQCPICGMNLVPVDGGGPAGQSDAAAGPSGEREVLFYRNPMDPTVTSPVPATDEMGMEYLPVYADEAGGSAKRSRTVLIDPAVVQNMNIRRALVERRDLTHEIRTVGYLEYDQERMVTVTTKYEGWVERVYVNYVGEPVRRGQPLFEIYAPELVQTEQELLSAIEYARKFEGVAPDARRRADALVDAARARLGYWDVSPAQIAELEETGEVFRTLTVVAPAGGLVMKRIAGLEGMAVRPGMEVYHIADLSSLWLSVEVFENQVAWVREGTPAEFEFTYFPGETFRGKVRFIEPEFDESSRTLRVKLEVPNPDGRLRSGMFATVVFQPTSAPEALTVPSLAVLRSGQRNVVVVDLGEGRFAPREVRLGREGQGYVQVLEGLGEGERVVTSAQFLIDSEASLQAAIQQLIAQRRPSEGAGEGGGGAR